MPDVEIGPREAIGIIAMPYLGMVDIAKVYQGRNRSIWGLTPEQARQVAAELAAEASQIDGLPIATAWLASVQGVNGEPASEANAAVFESRAAAMKWVADLCRQHGAPTLATDEATVEAWFDNRSGWFTVSETTITGRRQAPVEVLGLHLPYGHRLLRYRSSLVLEVAGSETMSFPHDTPPVDVEAAAAQFAAALSAQKPKAP
jgi:hypothetical protein